MPANPVTLIKVGGSLLDWSGLPDRLTQFLDRRQAEDPGFRPVLLCGGGPFAESVRRLDRTHHLGDYACHRLAIQTMDLASTALLCMLPRTIGILTVDELDGERQPGDIPLLVPSAILDELEATEASPLPHSWDVTSDTLSAWIAGRLKARSLILVKSASLPPNATREVAARLKLVDPFFPLISTAVEQVEYLNLRDATATSEVLP